MQKTKNDANRHLGNVVAMGRSRGMLILTVLKCSNRVRNRSRDLFKLACVENKCRRHVYRVLDSVRNLVVLVSSVMRKQNIKNQLVREVCSWYESVDYRLLTIKGVNDSYGQLFDFSWSPRNLSSLFDLTSSSLAFLKLTLSVKLKVWPRSFISWVNVRNGTKENALFL